MDKSKKTNLSEKMLNPSEILIAEFNYAMNTATQSNEDRVKIFQFIAANVITVAATSFFTSFNQELGNSLLGFAFLFFVILGILSLFQLSRLRLAWIDSVKAMNKIKDFYIEKYPELSEAFIWRTNTIPKADKELSLAHLLALTIIFLNSVSFSLGVSLIASFSSSALIIGVGLGLTAMILQLILWNRLLK